MRFLILLLILFCSISNFAINFSFAEDSSKKIVDDDLILFELEMAENGYTINKNVENKIRILSIYEKILVKRCLNEVLTTLGPSSPTKDEVCIDFIGRALKLDPGNIVALCVREGIDSVTCRYASERQVVRTYDPIAEEQATTASLDDVIAMKKDGEKIQEQTIELETKISYMPDDPKRKPAEILEEKVRYMKRILQINCTRPRIKIGLESKEAAPAQTTKTTSLIAPDVDASAKPTPEAIKGDDAFSRMLVEHFSTPTPEVEIPVSSRVYEITKGCSDQIDTALKLDPNIGLAYCYKWGFYSLQCMQALRKETQLKKKGEQGNLTHPAGNIEKF